MTKVSIVGAGNAGCFSALEYSWQSKMDKWRGNGRGIDEIELIHDSSIRPELAGQATFPQQPQLLWSAIESEFNYYSNTIHATPKLGILYKDWGKINTDVFHPFPGNQIAVHFCPTEMQDYVLNSKAFQVTDKKVESLDDIDADYVIDCRGKPQDLEEYDTLISPINAAILGRPKKDIQDIFTQHVATPDGWTFVIPTNPESPSYARSIGYLYNDTITSREDAEKNFQEIFDVEITSHSTFNNYVAKNPVKGRVILNGNKLFFLEPMEATAINTYQTWARYSYQFIGNKGWAAHHASVDIRQHIKQVETFILWHYKFGSKYDTPFWNYAKDLSIHEPLFHDAFEFISNKTLEDVKIAEAVNPASFRYGPWALSGLKYWHKGMTEELKQNG